MSGSRRVNFRDSPPSGSSSRYSSDSGLGSLSDKASTAANPDRTFTAHDVRSQWTDLASLQEAYRDLLSSKDKWKQKALRLDEEATNARKREKETEAKWRAIVSRNEELEDEKARIFKDRKLLAEDKEKLENDVDALHAQLADANAYIQSLQRNSPPLMSGAVPDAKPLRRSNSKREKDNFEGQKKRLEKRMGKEPEVKSETTTSTKTRSSRPRSYIEKWGPSEPRVPQAPPSPTSGRVQYQSFSQSTQLPPTISTTTHPTYSKVPRSAHPSVNVVTDEPYYEDGYVEDGSYHYYPLPNEPVRGHRSKHSK